jgi:hypothetical protein
LVRRWRPRHNQRYHGVAGSALKQAETTVHLLDDWFDPIEAGLRDRVREFIQTMIKAELEAALSRPRYGGRSKTDP